MKKFIYLVFALLTSSHFVLAGEGMWIPVLLQQLNEQEMQQMGMRITAEDIYSINQSSLKDAIVLFGRGCTGEIISNQGLLLTNHHCGYGQIQRHSTLQNDYLKNGFWAMNQTEELPNPGLTVTMMVKMEEVTEKVLDGVTNEMTESERNTIIKDNIKKITETADQESGLTTTIRPFYHGNQYYIIYNRIFKDIRLVGAPPSNIGKFGGDTDNWMWPRHTGDFSLFRIYVDKDGNPAEYHPDNIPYTPDFHLPISIKGIDEGDFTFVFGYPARTNQYLPAAAVHMITEVSNPARIALRQKRLEVFKRYSDTDPKIRIQYAAKDAGVGNAWKKMIGESKGIHRLHAIDRKQETETRFTEWAKTDPKLKKMYSELIPAFEQNYKQLEKLTLAMDYINEAGMGIELFQLANRFRPLATELQKTTIDPDKLQELETTLKSFIQSFFKDYHQPIDREVAAALLALWTENQPENFRPDFLNVIAQKGNVQAAVNNLFDKSMFTSPANIEKWMQLNPKKKLKKLGQDPVWQAISDIHSFSQSNLLQPMRAITASNDSLQRLYMKGLMAMQPGKRFYPDANFTLRVTYGKIEGYSPADAIYYSPYTTLDGIMEKENPDIFDYVVEDRLKELYHTGDFEPYADTEGRLRIAFAASNHTTGGNSGSPVLNADGQMIGLNFDRCWEGTMSDLMYDPAMCRNISVDIRYVLFIIDKFAQATHLIDEMTIIR
ncbi:MAG: S46 family peptidase [Bacteroidales bacterium]|nr:S46 family peptidase [Bacteroidales bacterium]